jgi:hypothetical protein
LHPCPSLDLAAECGARRVAAGIVWPFPVSSWRGARRPDPLHKFRGPPLASAAVGWAGPFPFCERRRAQLPFCGRPTRLPVLVRPSPTPSDENGLPGVRTSPAARFRSPRQSLRGCFSGQQQSRAGALRFPPAAEPPGFLSDPAAPFASRDRVETRNTGDNHAHFQ